MLSPTGSELNIAKLEPDPNPFLKTRARPEPVNFKRVSAVAVKNQIDSKIGMKLYIKS